MLFSTESLTNEVAFQQHGRTIPVRQYQHQQPHIPILRPQPPSYLQSMLQATASWLYAAPIPRVRRQDEAYLSLLIHGAAYFHLILPIPKDIDAFTAAEQGWINDSLTKLNTSRALQRLRYLSTKSYAWQSDARGELITDRRVRGPSDQREDRNYLAPAAFGDVAFHTNVETACQRLDIGESERGFPALMQDLQYRAHIDYAGIGVPVILGGHSRWYYCLPDSHEIPTLKNKVNIFVGSLIGHAIERVMAYRRLQRSSGRTDVDPPNHVDIYLPAPLGEPRFLDVIQGSFPTGMKMMYMGVGFPPTRHAKDVWNFFPLHEAPPCEACGWTCSSSDAPSSPPSTPEYVKQVRSLIGDAVRAMIPQAQSLLKGK
ncbi:uncharacterized protein MKK02DRAFT_29279 [Dioszegia hungarica]|uniref:Uncharacterized protein n=1 Tax=Dioszegia hungarica TaxID=4972 RepID=A0AA38LXY2_9TREE|nr:uncharacterized protein MKK02DRAFT_29279 [Dioszegia hungarica]KAI9639163.1 hypothetical protein MKK02DRAFT_29279 [Dioszegia hungarica]